MINDQKYQSDVRQLRELVPDHWALLGFFEFEVLGDRHSNRGHRASEMEHMVATTLHACVMNLNEYGVPFSFVNRSVHRVSGGGLVDNLSAWGRLLDEYLEFCHLTAAELEAMGVTSVPEDTVEDSEGRTMLCQPNAALIERLKAYLSKAGV